MDHGTAHCPLCSSVTSESMFELRNSPLLQNKLLRSTAEAVATPRVTVNYLYCRACRFAFNPAFDPGSVNYLNYYNDQTESPAYRSYVDEVARDVAAACGLGPRSRILEVGCGSAYFLSRLKSETGASEIVGFDPAYRGQNGMQENVRPRLLQPQEVEGTFDLIVLRHCLEGFLNVDSLVQLARRATSPSSRLFIEVTDLDRLLIDRNPSLLFHEYYRYFSPRAADIFLRQMGFRLEQLWSTFGGAYLGIVACRAPTRIDLSDAYRELQAVVSRHRKVIIWGASGRCISVLSHLGWDSSVVAFAADIDPAKQDHFLPVTGQRVLSPEEAVAYAPDLVIVANEVYAPEIRKRFTEGVRLVSLQGRAL
jgi:SAM-dependent methyltransferase